MHLDGYFTGNQPLENEAMRDSEEKQVQEVVQSDVGKKGKLERVGGHKKAEKTQQFSEHWWEDTFNAISDWIVLTDIEGRIIQTNQSGEKYTKIA